MYALVVLFGLLVIEPPERVRVPPVPIAIPVPFENVPEVRFRLLIVRLEVVANVELALLSVSVPNVVLPTSNPTSDGSVPVPSTTIVEEPVTAKSSGVDGAQAPLTVKMLLPMAKIPKVWVNVPTILRLPPNVTKPVAVRFNVKLNN